MSTMMNANKHATSMLFSKIASSHRLHTRQYNPFFGLCFGLYLCALLFLSTLISACSGSAATPTNKVPLIVTITNRDDAKANADGTWTVAHDDQIIVTCNTAAKKCKWTLQTSNASFTSTATEEAYSGTVIATEAAGRITLTAYADDFLKNELVLIVKPGVTSSEPTTEVVTTCTIAPDGKKTCTTTTTTCVITSKGKVCTVTTETTPPTS